MPSLKGRDLRNAHPDASCLSSGEGTALARPGQRFLNSRSTF
jgi:hypothetical protein